jgi:acyl carrier protein
MNTNEKLKFLKLAIMDIKRSKVEFDLTENMNLKDLGLDSLDTVELQMYYEEKTQQPTIDPVGPINTVKDLLDIMT